MNGVTPVTATKKQRNECKSRRLDRQRAVDLHARGVPTKEIAKCLSVNPSTVWRFLQQIDRERQAVEQFKSNRADVLARLQAKSLDAQERIIDTLNDEVVAALSPSQKSGMLIALNCQAGTSFDKERLERGESTSNLSVLSKMVDATVSTLYKPKAVKPSSGPPSGPVES